MRLFPPTFNLRQRLTLLLLLASLPGMAVAIVLAVNALASQSAQIEENAARLAALHAAQHTTVVEGARIMLDTLVEGQAHTRVERAECAAFLSNWIDRYPSFTSLTLVDAEGAVVCSNLDSELPFIPAESRWFEQVRSEPEFTVGQYTLGRTGAPLIVAARPVLNAAGNFAGAVAVGIDLRWLEFLVRRVDLPANTTVTALSADGGVLVHHVAAGAAADEVVPPDEPPPTEELRQDMAVLGTGTVRGPNAAGVPRVYGFRRTDSGGLVVAVGMSPYLAFAQYGAALRDTLTAPLTILLLALAAAWWGAERLITRWVRSLTRATRRMAAGDLSARSNVPHGGYEIGELAAAFDAMARSIQDSQERLRAAVGERGMLLRELNHRVKNNLQLIVSLVNLHASQVPDPGAREQVHEISNRVRALAAVHNLLYQDYRGERPIVTDYPSKLCKALRDLYRSRHGAVALTTELEPVALAPDQAIPFGLVLNELVGNAYKHAFPDGRTGTVTVRLGVERDEAGRGTAHLSVDDDGVGPPDGVDVLSTDSTGLRVIRALTAQLRGTLTFERHDGRSIFHLRFPLDDGTGGAGSAQPRAGRS